MRSRSTGVAFVLGISDPHRRQFWSVKLVPLTPWFGMMVGGKPARVSGFPRSDPTGIRTRVFAVRGRCPWPLGGLATAGFAPPGAF